MMEKKVLNEQISSAHFLNRTDTPAIIRKKVNIRVTIVILFVILVIFIISAVYIFFIRNGQLKKPEKQKMLYTSETISGGRMPFPYQEMTIPFLRNREYVSTMGEMEQVSSNSNYTSYLASYNSDSFKINAQLTRPAGDVPAGGFPAIVFIHGYIAPSNYQTLSSYSAYVDYLARNGFVVFKIDLRGHGNSEGEPNGAYYSGDYVVDALSARAALKDLDFVNPDKIGLWGHSMAGNVVFRSMVVDQKVPASVIWAGAVYTYEDWQKFGLNDNSYRPPTRDTERERRRQKLFDTYGEFDSDNDFWKLVVPTNYLEGSSGAIQLNHAVNDDVVDIGYSRGLASLLEGSLITIELNEYASGGHNISGSAFNQAMQNTVRFFRENLN